MKALIRKELRTFFSTLMGYVVVCAFLLLTGLFLWVFPRKHPKKQACEQQKSANDHVPHQGAEKSPEFLSDECLHCEVRIYISNFIPSATFQSTDQATGLLAKRAFVFGQMLPNKADFR